MIKSLKYEFCLPQIKCLTECLIKFIYYIIGFKELILIAISFG